MSSSLAYHLPSPSHSDKRSSLALAGLLHVAVVAVILGPWVEPSSLPLPSENSLKVQMFTLPQPVVEKPVVPVAEPIVPEQVTPPQPPQIKTEPVKKALAFEKVEVPEPAPPKHVEAREKPRPKNVEKRKPEPEVKKPVQETQQVAAVTSQTQPNKAVANTEPVNTAAPAKNVMATTASAAPAPFDVSRFKPVEKLAPDYPRTALRQGLEGDCTVTYTVNHLGRVESPEVTDDCHPAFIRPSLTAAKAFRYSPRKVNGKAVAVNNVSNTFQYRIQ